MVEFDEAARIRFERLPILRRLTELHFPTIGVTLQPGWFTGDGASFARQWGELKSLAFYYHLNLDVLRRFTEMPFWNNLTALRFSLSFGLPDILSVLGERLPPGLRELRIEAWGGRADANTGQDGFLERLAGLPLLRLHLRSIPLGIPLLRRLFLGTNSWQLRQLSLPNCNLTGEHVRVLAESPVLRQLESLNLSSNFRFDETAAEQLFSPDNLPSLTHLDLSHTRLSGKGAAALAGARGWDRLRRLNMEGAGLDAEALRKLLASPNLRHLTWLSIGGGEYPNTTALNLTPGLAAELTRLPRLASLQLGISRWDPRARQILSESDSLAWTSILGEEDEGIGNYRSRRAPERWPPLDDETELNLGEG
jgi:hypothetical protein